VTGDRRVAAVGFWPGPGDAARRASPPPSLNRIPGGPQPGPRNSARWWERWRTPKALGQVGHLVSAPKKGQLTFAPEPPASSRTNRRSVGKDAEQGLHQAYFAARVWDRSGGIGSRRQIKADVLHCHGALPEDRQPADFENHFRHQPSLPQLVLTQQCAKGAAARAAVAAQSG